ncbi:MAG: ABC transporter permease, partial [Candidatus Omnitrophica bacterium]|nr:ABC transporter permease [Candidatus Omnitrophota bacterium]
SSIQRASRCILESKNIIHQISFPKYLLPVAVVLVNLINFIPALLILIVFLIIFKVKLTLLIIFLPVVILIHTCLITGLSFMVSALQVIYRDVEYIIQVILMALFFLTPGVYTLNELVSKASPAFVKIYMLNPLVGILNFYRAVFINGYLKGVPGEVNFFNTIINPLLWSVVLLFAGYAVFKKYEVRFFDHLHI